MGFRFEPSDLLNDVRLIFPDRNEDGRGYFQEGFRASVFADGGLPDQFVQQNCSFSKAGVLRGLHFQKSPHAQGKLLQVVSGVAWSVAVDLRSHSKTFGRWQGFELGVELGKLIYLPEGFAHGFMALSDCWLSYMTTKEYCQASESGIRWDAGDLAIKWPQVPNLVSPKDMSLPTWKQIKEEINVC